MGSDLDFLLEKMDSTANTWQRTGDRRYIFLQCYTLMSRNMVHGIHQNRFADASWVQNLMIIFARYYFDALYKYNIHPDQAPAVWRHTHELTRDNEINAVQHLMLGINAHINYDLPLSLFDCLCTQWYKLNEFKKAERRKDHNEVNKIIAETIDLVQDNIIAPHSPFFKFVDIALGKIDEWMISSMVSSWRSRVWEVSKELINHCHDEGTRNSIISKNEMHTLRIAESILLGRKTIE